MIFYNFVHGETHQNMKSEFYLKKPILKYVERKKEKRLFYLFLKTGRVTCSDK